MSSKDGFSAEEWAAIQSAPALAGFYVLVAEPGGSLDEGAAIAASYGAARDKIWNVQRPSDLIEAVIIDGPAYDIERFGKVPDVNEDEIRAAALDRLREAVGTIRAKGSPQDVASFSEFVIGLAKHVAEAHKTGAKLGIFGGVRVTEAEQAALDELAAALG